MPIEQISEPCGLGQMPHLNISSHVRLTSEPPIAKRFYSSSLFPWARVIAAINEILSQHTEAEIAPRLNERGFQAGRGKAFSPWTIYRLRTDHKLRTLYSRLRATGMLDQSEIAKRLDCRGRDPKVWRRAGLLKARAYNDEPEYLYAAPDEDAPVRKKHKGISASIRRRREMLADPTKEVQCEA